MDRLTREHRSWNMSRIRGQNTAPERTVRSLLHRLGFRFRLHSRTLPGRPDVVLPKYGTIVLVHGCFWHRHTGCPFAYIPKSRTDFWSRKFAGNIARDRRNTEALKQAGWRIIVVWECELRNTESLARRLDRTLRRRTTIRKS